MTGKPRRPDGGDDVDSAGGDPSRPRRSDGPASAQSVSHGQQQVAEAAEAGRVGGARPGSGSTTPTGGGLTTPTGTLGGTPGGRPTPIKPKEDADVVRSISRENSGAVTLAENGYQIKQNPTSAEVAAARQQTGDTGDPDKNPDYLLEGHVFDAYSPNHDKGVRGIWFEVQQKIVKEQTQRVVVNLEDWGGNVADLRQQFGNWPIENLKEVKAITPNGEIIQIDLG